MLGKLHASLGTSDAEDIQETSWLRSFIQNKLDWYMGVIVSIDTLTMIVQTQWIGSLNDASLGVGKPWPNDPTDFFDISSYVFLSIYVVDLFLRICVLRRTWVYDDEENDGIMYLNIFDAFLVCLNSIELLLLPLVVGSSMEGNTAIVRVLKLLRLTKAFRVVRTVNVFRQLRILVAASIASLGALFWSVIMLFMVQVVFALLMSQSLHFYISDPNQEESIRLWLNTRYGDFLRALYTSFEITYSGGWPSMTRTIVEEVSAVYSIVFLCYVVIVIFGTIRVITAMFIKETLASAANNVEIAMSEKSRSAAAYREKLEDLFRAADVNGNEIISKDELEEALDDPIAVDFLGTMDINVQDVEAIFGALHGGDGFVDMEEWCAGISRLKGNARALDVDVLQRGQKHLHDECAEIKDAIQHIARRLP